MTILSAKPAPALPFSSPLQFLKRLRSDALGLLAEWAELGGVARFESRLVTSLLLTDPAAVQHVLQDNHQNYLKEVRSARVFRLGLGNGPFLSEDETWRAQRQAIQPAFHRRRLADMTDTMMEAIDVMLDRWAVYADRRQEFSLTEDASQLSLDVVSRALLGRDLQGDTVALGQALTVMFEYFSYAIRRLLLIPRFIPTRRNRAFSRALETTHRIVEKVIRHGPQERDSNLLALLVDVYGSNPDQLHELHDIITTLLGASNETTAVALSWTWYLLARNPEVESRLRQEVNSLLPDRRPRFEDLQKLTYTRMVIDEAMRLYPPAWVISRTALAEDEVCGYRIPAGSSVYVSAWVTHRSRRYWEDPKIFDPERFSSARRTERPLYAYYPFGGGPRTCIGDRFSLVEQTLALAMTVQKFRVRVSAEVVPEGLFTLHPRGGIRALVSSV